VIHFFYWSDTEDIPARKRMKFAGLTAVVAAPFQPANTSDVKSSSLFFQKRDLRFEWL
jgi:hypothetical protein